MKVWIFKGEVIAERGKIIEANENVVVSDEKNDKKRKKVVGKVQRQEESNI